MTYVMSMRYQLYFVRSLVYLMRSLVYRFSCVTFEFRLCLPVMLCCLSCKVVKSLGSPPKEHILNETWSSEVLAPALRPPPSPLPGPALCSQREGRKIRRNAARVRLAEDRAPRSRRRIHHRNGASWIQSTTKRTLRKRAAGTGRSLIATANSGG